LLESRSLRRKLLRAMVFASCTLAGVTVWVFLPVKKRHTNRIIIHVDRRHVKAASRETGIDRSRTAARSLSPAPLRRRACEPLSG